MGTRGPDGTGDEKTVVRPVTSVASGRRKSCGTRVRDVRWFDLSTPGGTTIALQSPLGSRDDDGMERPH